MQTVSAKTFSVSFPEIYNNIRVAWESIKAEQIKDNNYVSFITAGLNKVSFYKKYPGADLTARFHASCPEQRGTLEGISDKTLSVAGHTALVRTARSTDGFFFYYFGLVQINEKYCYTIIADCDTEEAAKYEPIFDEIWQSLQYFGDPEAGLKEQEAGIDEILSRYTTSEETEEKREKTPITPFSIPADGNDYWELDDYQLRLLPGGDVSVSDGDGALYIKLEAEMPDFDEAKHGHLLNDYEHGKVYLQFYFKGVYKNGIPTGVFTFEDERDSSYLTYLWKGGFHYSLQFTGEVTLQDGWLGINGHFENYPVSIAKKLPLEEINWGNYRFLSIAELETAPASIVRHVQLTDPYPALLHETLAPLKEMETLHISFSADKDSAADFKEVPKPVKHYKSLRKLTLSGIRAVDTLPQWIGDLKELEHLYVSESRIEGIHPYIFQLPKLKFCYLSNNQLQSISPGQSDSLETLTIENNKLTSLPDSLTKMPTLKWLSIKGNPFTKLPPGLENIEHLDLELEKKMALLDYSYKGADDKGTVPIDHTLFPAKYDDKLRKQVEQAIAAQELQPYQQGLTELARKAVAFATTKEDTYSGKGNSRFGGLPDLPAGVPYPSFKDYQGNEKGMQFIAQINCTDIAHLQDYLPRTGILYFFIEDQEDTDASVIYYDGDLSTLESAGQLNITEDYIYDQHGIYTPYKVIADKYASLPFFYNARDYYEPSWPELEALDEADEATDALKQALEPEFKAIHSINSYVFKQHDTPEKEAVHALKGNPEDWMVLLRVSSDSQPGFCFWDAGEIYFVIHKSDLAKKDFSRVYCGLESS
ncbi:Leucine rich repeat-containing protein [Chitinophaga sp. YR627]|uniref:DUF1963 domain-containing protein n=1 Tax=Chitinophaga sp. YR627 TaxID=1881041 RepID=UPI0008E97F54|nr:DUF1963 domain-containing protein [Chitinophaga sp. YR627]SFO76586.1 Leucine rich repeat-containing protein [Chitinophaga sp. YR627]